MANYTNIKSNIQSVINTNGIKAITGALHQGLLLAIINEIDSGSLFRGIAVPSTNPGNPDSNQFYFASQAGTYTNFANYALTDGLVVFNNRSGAWVGTKLDFKLDYSSLINTPTIPTVPTVGDGRLTIKKSASDVGVAFTANQTTDETVNLGLGALASQDNIQYSQINDTPTIPNVYDGKLTIKRNSTDTGSSFTANQSGNTDVDLNLGTMSEKKETDYRTATAQNAIDDTKIDTLVAGANVSITGTGNERTVSVTGISLPEKFTSTETGTGSVGTSHAYDLMLVTPIAGINPLTIDDIVIFTNGYQAQVVSISTVSDTFDAITILQPQSVSWGNIGGLLSDQDDLYTELQYILIKIFDNETDISTITTWLQNVYTKTESDNKFALISALSNFYTKIESDARFLQSITTSMVENVLTGLITTHTHSYLPDTYQPILNFVGNQYLINLTNLEITKKNATLSTGSNQSLTINYVSVKDEAFVIRVSATGNIQVAVPASGENYINLLGDVTFNVANGKTAIMTIHQDSSDNKYVISNLVEE